MGLPPLTVQEYAHAQNERGLRWFGYRSRRPNHRCCCHIELAAQSLGPRSAGLEDINQSIDTFESIGMEHRIKDDF